jgi:hypothetical protein
MRALRGIALVLGVSLLLLPRPSEAGRRAYIWAFDTAVVPEGDVELEQWLWIRGRAPVPPGQSEAFWIWWSPVLGLGGNLELQVPFQILANSNVTRLESFEADLRWRVFGREDTGPFQTMLRLVYHQGIGSASRVDANAVFSYDFTEQLHGVVDLGGRLALPNPDLSVSGPPNFVGTYDVGLAYRLGPQSEFHLSAELFGELPASSLQTGQHHFAGASVMWTRSRVWLTVGTLVGLTPLFPETPYFMPRLICGVVL